MKLAATSARTGHVEHVSPSSKAMSLADAIRLIVLLTPVSEYLDIRTCV